MHWEVWHGLGCTCEKKCVRMWQDTTSSGMMYFPETALLTFLWYFLGQYFSFKFVTLFPVLEIHGAWLTWRFPRTWPGVCSSSWWATDLQFPALAFFPFLCRMDRCQKRTSEVWLVIWGPDRRSGEVADLQAQYVPIFFLQTVRVALVLGLQITLGEGSFHPQPPWIQVPAISFLEDILRISFKLLKCINQQASINPKIRIATRKKAAPESTRATSSLCCLWCCWVSNFTGLLQVSMIRGVGTQHRNSWGLPAETQKSEQEPIT